MQLLEVKEKFLAHQICTQIENLQRVKEQIETDHMLGEVLALRLKSVEDQIRLLRRAV